MSTLEHREWNAAPVGSGLSIEEEQSLHRLFELVYSEGHLNMAQDMVASDFQGYCSGTAEAYRGVAGLKAHASRLRSVFYGLTVEIAEIRSTQEGFEARLTAEGRFERAFGHVDPRCVIGAPGKDPGGRMVQITGVASGALAEGQLRHCDFDWDTDELRDQR